MVHNLFLFFSHNIVSIIEIMSALLKNLPTMIIDK